jgi:phenylalanyl-tRNA synthetase alpha chain
VTLVTGTPGGEASLDAFFTGLDRLEADAEAALAAAADEAAVEAARVEFLGARSGRLKAVQKSLGGVPPSDRPAAGRRFNEAKAAIAERLAAAQDRVRASAAPASPPLDVTLPATPVPRGRLHPLTLTIRRVQEIMARLGFESVDGPEVEDQWHNFEALAIPPEHPARDPLDNFYLATAGAVSSGGVSSGGVSSGGVSNCSAGRPEGQGPTPGPLLLRSQTSTVQIRVMERRQPPLRIVSLGRVYRPDTADATHYPMFHQVEGLLVEPGTTMAHLKSVLRLFASSFLGGDVHVRFRPSFFPFTEPSVEVDMEWGGRWVEMGGAGMVDPAVLAAVGYDPAEVSGFAFGLGVERIAARRYGVADIRDFYRNDVRFLAQFS